MAKGKSSKKKDDDDKKKDLKKTSEKKQKKESKPLKGLSANQKKSPMPADKSLNSLKKIQKQLDRIVARKEAENKKIKQLKNNTTVLSKQTTALSKQTAALNKQTTALSKHASTLGKRLEKSELQHSKYALDKDLGKIKTALEKKNSQFSEETGKLSKEIALLKDLTHRVEHKIQTLEKQPPPAAKQFHSHNKKNTLLLQKVSDFEEQLNQFTDTIILPDEAILKFSERLKSHQQRIKRINKNYQNQNAQIQQLTSAIEAQKESSQNHNNALNKSFQKLTNTVSTVETAQQQLLSPIETRLQELQKDIQSVHQENTRQQQTIPGSTEALAALKSHQLELKSRQQDFESHWQDLESRQLNIEGHQQDLESRQQDIESHQQGVNNLHQEIESHQLEINSKVALFKDQLQQSQDELKQHIQLLHNADQEADLEQSREFKDALKRFSEHLSDISEQTNSLQSLFNSLQTQQNTDNAHHQKLSKQYLLQQQQLKKHHSQLLQLIPVISQTEKFSHQFEQITKTQNNFLHQENNLKSNLQTLAQKTTQSHGNNQKTFEQLANHQQDQSVSLTQLNEQIKKRSLLFGFGLLSALAISTLLFFNLQSFNQTTQENASSQQTLIARIKTDINNETSSKINALNKQNTNNIKQQFSQIRESISQANPAMDVTELQNNWQEQHQLLQDGLSKTQTEQQTLNQTVAQLSESISVTKGQFQQLQKSMTQNSDISRQNKLTDITITRIENITSPFYTIQLLGAMQKESVMDFIKEHSLAASSRIFQTEFQGKIWYILVQGHYSGISQAKEKLQQLPDVLRKNAPWIKKLP